MTMLRFDTSDLAEAFIEPMRTQLQKLDGMEANAETLGTLARTLQEAEYAIGVMVTKDGRIVIDKPWRFA